MKNTVYGLARNEDQAHKLHDQLLHLGFSNQEICLLFPQQNISQQNPKQGTNPQQQGQQKNPNQQQQRNPNQQQQRPQQNPSNLSLRSLNLPDNDIKKFEENIKNGQYFVAVQSDNNDKLEKAQDLFRKEGLRDVASTRQKAQMNR